MLYLDWIYWFCSLSNGAFGFYWSTFFFLAGGGRHQLCGGLEHVRNYRMILLQKAAKVYGCIGTPLKNLDTPVWTHNHVAMWMSQLLGSYIGPQGSWVL